MLEVMQSRLGIAEIPGAEHNPIIVGWFRAVGHPEVITDEASWCAAGMGSAAMECGLPTPPHNTVLMARSWLTWGVKVELEDVKPGDVAIWPRGDPKGWQGHVNIVEAVHFDGTVSCIGANQSQGRGKPDAVTRSSPRAMIEALGFRRAVPATVPALREAGSTTIKGADNLERAGIGTIFITPVVEGIRSLLDDAPKVSSKDGISYWQTLTEVVNDIVKYAIAHPMLAGLVAVGIILFLKSRYDKRKRVAEHAAGIPIAAEVAKVGA